MGTKKCAEMNQKFKKKMIFKKRSRPPIPLDSPIPLTEMAALSRLSSDQGEGEVRMGRREAACRFSCLNLRQAV